MSSTKPKPPSVAVFPWLRANLGNRCLGCLTGYSTRVIRAAVEIIDAMSCADYERRTELLEAFRLIVKDLDRPERELVFHSIAMIMNWDDRGLIWAAAGLEPLRQVSICVHEPQYRKPNATPAIMVQL